MIIDQEVQFVTFAPNPGVITASITSLSNYEASYGPTDYTFSITPNKVIFANSRMRIVFPPHVTIVSSLSLTLIKNGVSIDMNYIGSTPPFDIWGAFPTDYTTGTTPITLILKNLRNPSTDGNISFEIYFYDS